MSLWKVASWSALSIVDSQVDVCGRTLQQPREIYGLVVSQALWQGFGPSIRSKLLTAGVGRELPIGPDCKSSLMMR